MELTNHGIGKRALALLLTAVLVLSLCATVMETRAEETYTVTFDLSGFDGWLLFLPANVTDNKITFSKGEIKYFPSLEWDPARLNQQNAVLVYWEDSNENKYNAHDLIPEKNETYKARLASWPGSYYTLKVTPGEHFSKGVPYIITDYNNFTVPSLPEDYAPESGYHFVGWKVLETGEVFGLADIEKGVRLSKKDYDQKTLEAVWVEDGKHVVAFDAGVGKFNGIFGDGNAYLSVVNDGESAYFPFAVNQPKDDIYVLEGWKSDDDSTVYAPGTKTPSVTKDVVYRAKWGTKNISSKVKVTVRNSNIVTSFYYYTQGSGIPIPSNPFGEKPNQIFSGWSLVEKSFMGDSYDEVNEGETYTLKKSYSDEIILTAKWAEKYPDHKINYHFNSEWGSYKKDEIVQGYNVRYMNDYKHEIMTASDAFSGKGAYFGDAEPRPKGCVFAGWSTTPGGPVDSTYAVGNTVTLSDNLDLYAVWEEAFYGYTVKQHYVNTDNSETVKDTSGTAQIDSPIPYDKGSIQHDGKTYVFDSGKEPKEQLITADTSKNVIDVYYDIDTLNDANDTDTEADGIADKYQRTVTYKVENGTWADGTADDKTEIVTLMEGEEYSETGTAQLTVPALGEPGNGNLEGRWSTVDGKAPTSVTASGPFEYTYHFLDKDEAIVIQPAEVHVTYDGTEHTFTEFTATKLSGEPWPNITVELKQGADLAGCGWTDATESGGVTIDLNRKFSENNVNWKDIFDIKGLDAGQENNVTFGTGTIIIDPCPVEVELNVTELTELKAGIGSGKEGDKPVKPTYKYDQADKELIAEFVFDGYEHTISLDPTIFDIKDSKGNKVAVELAPDDGSTTITLSATKVGDAVDATLDLTSAALELADAGAEADNYTVGSSKAKTISRAPIMNSSNEEEITDLAGKEVEKISIRIIPRPVSYWTYGGAKIYDGAGIPKDDQYGSNNMNHSTLEGYKNPDGKQKGKYIGEPRYEEIVKYDGEAIEKDARGFVVRGTTTGGSSYTTLNHRPWKVESESPIDVGIKDTEVTIVEFGNEYVKVDVMNDYAIEYHNGYYAIYPQSITDNPSFYDSGFDTVDTFKDASYDDKVIEYTYKDRDAKTAIPSAEELTAFYTGVKLTDDFAEAYPYDGKPHIAEAGALRNDNNAEGKQDLTEGTDYTVTYYRQDDKGNWNIISDDKDFVEPGKIKIVYQGIGNYRNRIEKEYSIVSGNGGLIPPDPPTPGGPDVELDDHDHYAYIIGKPGGIVDPNGEITRAEIATVIFRLLKEEVREQYWSKENSFPDVEITDWYNNAVSTLEKLGVVEGKDDGLFHPDDPITRAEMATMMVRLYDYDVDTGGFHTKFDDVDPAAWYARYVAAAEELALFLGDGSTSHFYPDRSLTRAEAMTVYNRLLGRKPHKDGLLPEEQMILWPDNMDATAWYYADVQEATNSHTCVIDGLAVGGERFERWLSPLPVRDWAALEQAWSEAHSGYDGHDVN